MQCPNCEFDNPEGMKFCGECGASLKKTCPNCKFENPPQFKFCGECGTSLTVQKQPASESVSIPRLEEMQDKIYIPKPLSQRMQAAEQELVGENRLVTVLFADISGFTPLSRQHSPERVVEIINDCFKSIVDVILSYEGSINRFIGDCVLAFFGAPITHENDPERAILAALDFQEAIKDLSLSLSVGINSGMMYFGPIGTQQHLEISAYGPDINLAKRMQEVAQPEQILVGKGTYRLTRRIFDFQRLEGLALKGIGEAEVAYEVLRVSAHPEKLRGIEGLRAQMIGREREFVDLKEATDQWLAGQGQMVSVIGEAGIGKSRLVTELKTYLSECRSGTLSVNVGGGQPETEEGIPLLLEGRCVSIGQPISYWPFLDLLRAYFNVSETDAQREIVGKVTEGITALFGQGAGEILPFIGRLLSIRFGNELDQKLEYLTPQQIQHQTQMRLRDLFETLAREQPLLLILEDCHWADDHSLDLLSLLMDSLATTPLMLLCVYRPEREHRVFMLSSIAQRKCLDRFTEIRLQQLTSHQSRRLVEELLTIDNLPESLKETILGKSEGNPFFIEEVIRSLIDQDLVYREGESSRWKARAEISDIDVPDTIQSVVLARVDRLQAEAKHVLQCASVIGRLFKYRLLEHLTQQERALDRYLSEFEERELVYEERSVPELEYAFKHAFTQEATYQGILERRQRAFHHQVATGIERLYQERLEEYYEELAHHYSKSDDTEKAVQYLLKAGEKARRSFANEAAIAHFQKGLMLLKTLPDTPERAQDELTMQIGKGSALMVVKGYGAPEVVLAYERARELCQQVGETPQIFPVLFGLCSCYRIRGNPQTSCDLARQFLHLAQRQDDQTLLLVAHRVLGVDLMSLGEFATAREYLQQALALYEPQQHRSLALTYSMDPQIAGLSNLAWTLWYLGYPDQAVEKGDEAVALAQELSHPLTLAYALNFAAMVHLFRREGHAAQEQAEAMIEFSTEKGIPLFVAWGTLQRGWALAEGRQVQEGIAQMHQGLEASRATGTELERSRWLALLAKAYGKAGEPEEGLNLLTEVLAAVDKTGERFHEAEVYRVKGELLLKQNGDETTAEACFHKGIEVAQRQQAKSWELRASISLSRLWQKHGKTEEARALLAEIYGWFTEGFDTVDLQEARALLEELS